MKQQAADSTLANGVTAQDGTHTSKAAPIAAEAGYKVFVTARDVKVPVTSSINMVIRKHAPTATEQKKFMLVKFVHTAMEPER